jgi:hypothetical protein
MTQGPGRRSDWGLFHWPTLRRLRPVALAATVGLITGCPGHMGQGLAAPLHISAQASAVAQLPEACHTALPPSSQGTVVMVISPRMVYSMGEWPRMRGLAEAAGFQVVTWRSPDLLPGEWAQAVQTLSWSPSMRDAIEEVPPACAPVLGTVNHFPYSVVIAHNRIHSWPIWGVLSDEAWATSLAHRLNALSPVPIVSQGAAR